ncbi:hypothetical protein LLEC1_03112 [Akanthomyces lecanii]|uniref:Uncharacterized protein n=1 Tax=Cordyceps confragosa TaxID=2714763 RepID=A0A179I2G9_CORDF|nr:hypothetical protein LLEC1_03112 [Akanthomyces lecanii]
MNLPFIFPRLTLLFKRHLAPILSLRSSRSGHSATGFRTIGGGDGNGGAGVRHRRNPPQSVYPLPTKLTITQSAEQLVDNGIKLQKGKPPRRRGGLRGSRNEHGRRQPAHATPRLLCLLVHALSKGHVFKNDRPLRRGTARDGIRYPFGRETLFGEPLPRTAPTGPPWTETSGAKPF